MLIDLNARLRLTEFYITIIVYGDHNMKRTTNPENREILLALWKIHILHHAGQNPIYGLWMLEELAEHGYRLSPGTLYPILSRMVRNGWLRCEKNDHAKGRRNYRITPEGRRLLRRLRKQIDELQHELAPGPSRKADR